MNKVYLLSALFFLVPGAPLLYAQDSVPVFDRSTLHLFTDSIIYEDLYLGDRLQAPVNMAYFSDRDVQIGYNDVVNLYDEAATGKNYGRQGNIISSPRTFCGIPLDDLRSGMPFDENTIRGLSCYGDAEAGSLYERVTQQVMPRVRAVDHRKRLEATYEVKGPVMGHAASLAYHTGLSPKGWAFSTALSGQLMPDAYVAAAKRDALSYYIAVSRQFSSKGSLHWITFGQPSGQQRAVAATKEAIALAGTNYYNPGWGYLDGRKRNANTVHDFRPVSLLQYCNTPDAHTQWYLTLAVTAGMSGSSSLDWYHADDPRPDYYKNLPGYYLNGPAPDTAKAAALEDTWKRDTSVRQLNWEKLYETNRMNTDSTGNAKGKRSLYVLGEDRSRWLQYTLGADFRKTIRDHWQLDISFQAQRRQDENDRCMLDLLGGDYFPDLNQFAESSYGGNAAMMQQDLNHPDRAVKTGERYAYSYKAFFSKAALKTSLSYEKERWAVFATGSVHGSSFQRKGLFRNGVFADDSYGSSKSPFFLTYNLQAGFVYQNEGQALFLRSAMATQPPLFDHTFIAPRKRNTIVAMPAAETNLIAEAGYKLGNNWLSADMKLMAGSDKNATSILRFYHDDYKSFVNYVMRNIDKQQIRMSLDLRCRLSSLFAVSIAGSWQQCFYTSDPVIGIFRDNDILQQEGGGKVYFKNSFVATGPQSVIDMALQYKDRHAFFVMLSGRYLGRNYIAMNPLRRTGDAVRNVAAGSETWHRITDQEQLPATWTVYLQAGRSFLLPHKEPTARKRTLYIGVDVRNLLNNQNQLAGGWEQLRFDSGEADPTRFPTKYKYAGGTVATLKAALHF